MRHFLQIGMQLVRSLMHVDFRNQAAAFVTDSCRCFASSLRRETGDTGADGLVKLAAGLGLAALVLRFRGSLRVQLALRGRISVGQTGQNLTHTGDILADMARRVDDASVSAAQDNV